MTTAQPALIAHDTSAPTPDADRLVLTITEAAEVLGISRAFAYELCARGELPVIRLGRRRLVPKKALLALIGVEEAASPQAVAPSPLYRLVAEPERSR